MASTTSPPGRTMEPARSATPIPNDLGDLTNRENRFARQRCGRDLFDCRRRQARAIVTGSRRPATPTSSPTITRRSPRPRWRRRDRGKRRPTAGWAHPRLINDAPFGAMPALRRHRVPAATCTPSRSSSPGCTRSPRRPRSTAAATARSAGCTRSTRRRSTASPAAGQHLQPRPGRDRRQPAGADGRQRQPVPDLVRLPDVPRDRVDLVGRPGVLPRIHRQRRRQRDRPAGPRPAIVRHGLDAGAVQRQFPAGARLDAAAGHARRAGHAVRLRRGGQHRTQTSNPFVTTVHHADGRRPAPDLARRPRSSSATSGTTT